jgi:hypothetical protein
MGSGRVFFGRHRRLLGEKHTPGGKHRTEVTEVTEGDGQWPGVLWAIPAASWREIHARGTRQGEAPPEPGLSV